jgi:phage tail-like protein
MTLNINFRDLLPEVAITARDRGEIVRNVMDAMQQNYEILDAEIDGLLVITDVDVCPEFYLDYIAGLLGIELLGLDTPEQKRTLIKNIVAIYKIKGTLTSWEIIFKSIGFGADIVELWWDAAGLLVDTDPMLGHLFTGLDPINPDVNLLGRFTVAEINNPLTNPLNRLTQEQINALLNPVSGDSYEIENSGLINPGAVPVVANDIIQWNGVAWIKIPHYKTINALTADLTRPLPSDGIFASVLINDITSPGTLPTLTVTAGDVGPWGNLISVEVEDGTEPLTDFNLIVYFDAVEVVRFDDLSKDLNVGLDNIEVNVNTETFYITVSSIDTFGVELRPLNGVYPLIGGDNPRNTKSPYIDIILSVEFIDCLIEPDVINKAAFFDGRIKEVKPAHIRLRAKRIDITVSENADLELNDDDLTVEIQAELVDILQPQCNPPAGAIIVFFHNGFIRGRTGIFTRGLSINFPNGIPNDPGAIGGGAGYIYAYDGLDFGSHGLTYGDFVDNIFNPFKYGFVFDEDVCAVDTITALVNNDAIPFQDDNFYGVSIPSRITYNSTFNYNGYMPYHDAPINPATVDGDPNDNADPQSGVTVIRCFPATNECITVLDWKFADT